MPITDILVAALGAYGVYSLLRAMWGRALLPVKLGAGAELTAVLRVRGSMPELERTVDAIEWLRESGMLPVSVIIVDSGMDDETRRTARLLTRRELVEYMEETAPR